MQTPNLCPKSWLSTLDFPTLILLPFIIYKDSSLNLKQTQLLVFNEHIFLCRYCQSKKKYANEFPDYWTWLECSFEVCTFLDSLFLPLNEIHCAFQGYNFISTEARLMGEESNFTTFAHSRIMCWFKMKPHYRFYCLFPHYIYSVLQINDLSMIG